MNEKNTSWESLHLAFAVTGSIIGHTEKREKMT